MSLDAAKRALFDALDPPLQRAVDARLPAGARSARAGGLVHIEQSGRNRGLHSGKAAGAAVSEAERDRSLFAGKLLRGRWIHDPAYQGLRNACWMLRQSRVGGANNPLALQLVCAEAVKLREQGQQDFDIFEAFGEWRTRRVPTVN